VTVLFADVNGSMDLAEQVDSEEWHRTLDRLFQILTAGAHRSSAAERSAPIASPGRHELVCRPGRDGVSGRKTLEVLVC